MNPVWSTIQWSSSTIKTGVCYQIVVKQLETQLLTIHFTARTKKSLYSLLKHQNLPAWVWKWTSKIQRATALIKYPVEDHFPVVRADGYSKLEVSSLVAGSQLHNFHVKCHSRARSNSRQLVCHLFSIYKYCPWNSQQIYQYFSFSY